MSTLVGTQKDLNTLLAKLIELDFDAVEAYEAAIARLGEPEIRETLSGFRDDHRRHIVELSDALRQSGREPPTGPDAKRLLAEGKVVIAGLIGDKAILIAMKTNEDDTNTAYERAVNHDAVPSAIRDLLRSALNDERRHRAYIEGRLEALG